MTCPSHRRLSIPAWLAVGSLGAATACGGDDGSTTAADTSADDADDDADDDGSSSGGPSTADDSAESSSASGTTTAPSESSGDDESTTRGDDTGVDSGTSGGDYCFGDGSNPACDVTEQAACEGIDVCIWTEPGYCGANCTAITDRSTCCEQFECEWQFGACDYGAI
jgi:hypothetical protein